MVHIFILNLQSFSKAESPFQLQFPYFSSLTFVNDWRNSFWAKYLFMLIFYNAKMVHFHVLLQLSTSIYDLLLLCSSLSSLLNNFSLTLSYIQILMLISWVLHPWILMGWKILSFRRTISNVAHMVVVQCTYNYITQVCESFWLSTNCWRQCISKLWIPMTCNQKFLNRSIHIELSQIAVSSFTR